MQFLLLTLAVVLVVSLVAGLVRIMLGPTATDRMLAAQLMGTSGVGLLVLLAQALNIGALRDVALVFALLAAMAAVAFVQRPIGDPVEPKP